MSQIFNFALLGSFLLGAEKINEFMASQTWLSKTNYFDSSGMFFTFAISFPVITHLLILVILWVKRTADQLVKVKRQEVRMKLKKSREGEVKEDEPKKDK
ncbi:Oidioi.mRNA.OKI2018_I69.chr2.g7903.t1.cds [Oikopleura dioica]|uniref:Oidioi.mRNA.OKI2018_I69.chr2.g7903.t1.cds n=1 Tax=Oikopleura dioica TaxID=34765 RepID=A0ABN7T7M6_OIKDI|nr:Oidioi.mRNA.OKI2018_I69.chr2.g7903.t1.cds [Oikopleura dioica]